MCRAVPALVARIEGSVAWIVDGERERPVSLLAVDGVTAGDYVYHHAGLALERVDAEEARAVLALLDELEALFVEATEVS